MTGRLFGAKIILHDMGQYIRDLYEGSTPLFKKMMRWFMSSVSASIVLGESPKQLYGGFLVKERVLSVPGSVSDSRVFFPGSPKSHHGVNVLFFSFLSVSKGLLTALEAVPVVVRENPDVSFTFVGPIESQGLHDQMEEFIKKHNIQDRIEYVGYVGDEAKRTDYLRNADIFIFPTHRDVFGLVLLHAMAEHLPVVASFEGSIPEIIDEGQGGFLFSKGDASALASKILLLAKDPQRRREMGDYNRQKYLLEYTPERFGQKMIRAFQEIQNFK